MNIPKINKKKLIIEEKKNWNKMASANKIPKEIRKKVDASFNRKIKEEIL